MPAPPGGAPSDARGHTRSRPAPRTAFPQAGAPLPAGRAEFAPEGPGHPRVHGVVAKHRPRE
ncbi:hypothetical protein GCM10019016_120150 [Streptomyces prasinosporus]|uniref:Uncharacterized protein n=1 Tax=Streptomyces prasinosporus TaxID=68256 RepID=A0ABP6UB85_9ACTN